MSMYGFSGRLILLSFCLLLVLTTTTFTATTVSAAATTGINTTSSTPSFQLTQPRRQPSPTLIPRYTLLLLFVLPLTLTGTAGRLQQRSLAGLNLRFSFHPGSRLQVNKQLITTSYDHTRIE